MVSERCAEQGASLLGTMGSPFTARRFERTYRGQYCEMLMKRSGNTEFSPSSYLIGSAGFFY